VDNGKRDYGKARAPTSMAVKMRTDMYERPRDVLIRPFRRYHPVQEEKKEAHSSSKKRKTDHANLSLFFFTNFFLFLFFVFLFLFYR